MNLKFNKTIKASFVIYLLLAGMFIFELYLAYTSLYLKMRVADELVIIKNVVRVDLKSYEEAIDHLDLLENYQPPPLTLQNPNPFQ